MKLDEKTIQYLLWKKHYYANVFTNIHTEPWGGSEVDSLYVTDAGYCTFYEIKCSYSDFKADFKKPRHSNLLARSEDLIIFPHKFIYVCSGFVPDAREIPEYAGCLIVDKLVFKVLKKAPKLYSYKLSETGREFLNKKIYHRYLELSHKVGRDQYMQIRYGNIT